jgi:Ca2+-binding EF-hand superfamily protein
MLNNRFIHFSASLLACIGIFTCSLAYAAGKSKMFVADSTTNQSSEEANAGLQQTLNLNFSPENREKLRRALDEYARSVDQNHAQVEENRRLMRESIERRFLDADSDGDGSVDRQEATEKLPQIARQFSQVDTNHDEVITIDELEEAQARIMERRRAAEMALQEQKLQAVVKDVTEKTKEKQTGLSTKKSKIN